MRWAGASTRTLRNQAMTTRCCHTPTGGVSKGAMSWLVVYPDYGLSIAVNINTRAETFSLFAGVEKKIAAAFLEQIAQLKGTKEISSRAAIDRD